MKVLLIYPPETFPVGECYWVHPPLGLAYIAAVLEKAGHRVNILDSVAEKWRRANQDSEGDLYHVGLSWDELKERVASLGPDLVGVSCPFSAQSENAHRVAKIVKDVDADIPVVFGGAHTSALPVQTLKDPNIDFVIIGEGECTILAVVDMLERKEGRSNVIDGLGYKEKDGEIKINHKTKYIEALPFPARHLLPMREYFKARKTRLSRRQPVTTMITSRGCPKRCTFCSIHSVWGYRWRARSPKNVVDEIEHLIEEYGVKEIHFEDDNLTLDKRRMTEICDEMVDRGLDVAWTTPNGVAVDTLDKKLLFRMKAAGCYALFFGIESGNSYVLNKVIRKGLSLERVRKVVGWTREAGIDAYGYFVIGMPGETRKTLQDTLNFAKSLDLDVAWFLIATPYPGTELFETCKSNGYLKNRSPSRLKPRYASIETDHLSAEYVEKFQKRAYMEFELHKFLKHPLRYFRRPHESKWIVRNLVASIRGWS